MNEKEEQAYLRGQKAAALEIMCSLAPFLDADDPALKLSYALEQLQSARLAARYVCEDVLDIEYPGDDLSLADVIEKHIGRSIPTE